MEVAYHMCRDPVAPVAYKVILEPGIGQFVSSSPAECILVYIYVGTFACAQIDLRKARERELATNTRWKIDEQWDC